MTANYIEVLPIGENVKIGGEIEATIIAISIRGLNSTISYECQWVSKLEIKNQWIDEIMIKPDNGVKKIKIGFKNKE